MFKLFEGAAEIQKWLILNEVPFCFIGGIANIRWGEIRTTNDVDLTVLCGFGNEEAISKVLLEKFQSRISDPIPFAINQRVLLLLTSDGIPIDVALSGLDFEEDMIKRASNFEISPGIKILTCSAEDLIITKAFANRPKDIQDIESIISRQQKKLDRQYIFETLEPLAELKGDKSIVSQLKKRFDESSI